MAVLNIKALENDLWDAADELRAGSRLSSQEYSMHVLGLIYLRYAFSRKKHFPDFHVSAPTIEWQLDNGNKYLLPAMQSDIVIENDKKNAYFFK